MCTFVSVVTDQVRREQTLKDIANRDDLTNLYNRRYLMELFAQRPAHETRTRYLPWSISTTSSGSTTHLAML